jgi:hypothetical protein
MGKPKVVAKKATKKTTPAPVKRSKGTISVEAMIVSTPRPSKPALKKFVPGGRKAKAMEYEELVEENQRLKEQVKELTDARNELTLKIEELEDKPIPPDPPTAKNWMRGKLPGERFIKTDPETGKFEEIDKAEWDSLR